MTNQRRRAQQVLDIAQRAEHGARAELAAANQSVVQVGEQISAVHRSGLDLGTQRLDPRLQASFNETGARKLILLSSVRDQLRADAKEKYVAWDQSRMKVQSLDKLVGRIRQAEQDQARRREAAELLDAITASVASSQSRTVGRTLDVQ